jgi:hypothetical protein
VTAAALAQFAGLARLLAMLDAELLRLLHLLALPPHAAGLRAAGGVMAWSAVRLDEVRTDVLAGLDLRRGPCWAVRQVRRELAARRDEHEILPRPGSQRDGEPYAGPDGGTVYPVEAVCDTCGRPVRCTSVFAADWVHTDPGD